MAAIRRANLDVFWRRKPGTFRENLTMIKVLGKMAREELGLEELIPRWVLIPWNMRWG